MAERVPWEELRPDDPHVWRTLGYRRVEQEAGSGRNVIEWDATEDYAFPTGGGWVIHGGLVTTLLDTAMGGACWTVLDEGETFLTADLRAEFIRATRPGTIRAEGRVVHKTRRLAFCEAEAFDTDGELLAAARCTQVLRSDRR
jgi:uncharacterized protein (TIGR00369 family)